MPNNLPGKFCAFRLTHNTTTWQKYSRFCCAVQLSFFPWASQHCLKTGSNNFCSSESLQASKMWKRKHFFFLSANRNMGREGSYIKYCYCLAATICHHHKLTLKLNGHNNYIRLPFQLRDRFGFSCQKDCNLERVSPATAAMGDKPVNVTHTLRAGGGD